MTDEQTYRTRGTVTTVLRDAKFLVETEQGGVFRDVGHHVSRDHVDLVCRKTQVSRQTGRRLVERVVA